VNHPRSLFLSLLTLLAVAVGLAAGAAQAASAPAGLTLQTAVGRSAPLASVLVGSQPLVSGITSRVAAHGYDLVVVATGVAAEGGGSGEPSIHSTLRGGERGIEPSEVTQNGDLYFDSESGNKVYVLGTGSGVSEVVIQSPDGTDITTYRISDTTLQNRLNSRQWLDPNG